jgi:hypothetical protein
MAVTFNAELLLVIIPEIEKDYFYTPRCGHAMHELPVNIPCLFPGCAV